MLNIVIFGPPGCGKGTQSEKISKKYNLVHLSTGDIIRKEIHSESEMGKILRAIVEQGELVPYELIIAILETALKENKNAHGFIFDGFPRTIKQAEDLAEILEKENRKISIVLSLKVSENILVERLLHRAQIEGRKDDTEEVIKNRLKVYNEKTVPLIDWYKGRGKYFEINGECSIDEIFEQICHVLEKKKLS